MEQTEREVVEQTDREARGFPSRSGRNTRCIRGMPRYRHRIPLDVGPPFELERPLLHRNGLELLQWYLVGVRHSNVPGQCTRIYDRAQSLTMVQWAGVVGTASTLKQL